MVAALWHYESTRSLSGNSGMGFQIPGTWEPFPQHKLNPLLDHRHGLDLQGSPLLAKECKCMALETTASLLSFS